MTMNQETINLVVGNAHGNLTKVQELADQYPEILTARAVWDETPMGAAAHMGNQAIVKFLLSRGVPMDIFAATALGDADQVQAYLWADPSQVNARGAHSMPLLYHAVAANQRALCELILAQGADVNLGADANTALHAAAYFDRTDLATWLLANGADVNAKDYQGKTPLALAINAEKLAVADLFRQHGGVE